MGMSVDQRGFASANTAVGNRRDYLDNKQTSELRCRQGDDPLRVLPCDNWWTQPHGFQLAIAEGRQQDDTL